MMRYQLFILTIRSERAYQSERSNDVNGLMKVFVFGKGNQVRLISTRVWK